MDEKESFYGREFGEICLNLTNAFDFEHFSKTSFYISLYFLNPKNITMSGCILPCNKYASDDEQRKMISGRIAYETEREFAPKDILIICDDYEIDIPEGFKPTTFDELKEKNNYVLSFFKQSASTKLYINNEDNKILQILYVKRNINLLRNANHNCPPNVNILERDYATYLKKVQTESSNDILGVCSLPHIKEFYANMDFSDPSSSMFSSHVNSMAGEFITRYFKKVEEILKDYYVSSHKNAIRLLDLTYPDLQKEDIEKIKEHFNNPSKEELCKLYKELLTYSYYGEQNNSIRFGQSCREWNPYSFKYFSSYNRGRLNNIKRYSFIDHVDCGFEDFTLPHYFLEEAYWIKLENADNVARIIENKRKEYEEREMERFRREEEERKRDFNLKNRYNQDELLSNENSHYYLHGQQLLGITRVINNFFPKFDADYWAGVKAPLMGRTPQQLLEEWDRKGKESSEAGTILHQRIDDYYHHKEVQTEDKDYTLFKQFADAYKLNPYRNEWAIFDEDSGIVGVVDMLDYTNGEYILYDWKRSEKVVEGGQPITKNKFDEYGLKPIENVPNTDYWHYALQLSFYRYILEKNYGIRIKESRLVVLHPNLNLPVVLTTPYMIDEVNKIIAVMKM